MNLKECAAVVALVAMGVGAGGWGDALPDHPEQAGVADGDYSRIARVEGQIFDSLSAHFKNNTSPEDFLLLFEEDIIAQYQDGKIEEYEYRYVSAFINQELYTIYYDINYPRDEEKARIHQARAFEHATKVVALNEDYANIYALYADILLGIFEAGGANEFFQYNGEREANIKRALKLDTNNSPALQNDGRFKLHAPGIVGGSIKKAIISFENAIKYGNALQQQRSTVWLSVAYFKNGDTKGALALINELIAEYPENDFLKLCQRSYKAGTNPLELR